MKYTINGNDHAWSKKVKFATLQELAQHLKDNYDLNSLCCVEDEDGWGYNPVDLVEEELEAAE